MIYTRVEKGVSVTDVTIVRDFLVVFSEELPGMPTKRQVTFMIDLVHGAALIAKETYRLVLPEMQELSSQLWELLRKRLSY